MVDRLLETIGFTAKQFSISNEILHLLETLSKNDTSYLSLLPREIFNIVINNSRITPKQLYELADNYEKGYILIKSTNFVIILFFNEKSRCDYFGIPRLTCNYFIIECYVSIHYDKLYISVKNNIIDLGFYNQHDDFDDTIDIKYDESEIYFIEPINNGLLRDAAKLLNSIILRELHHYNYINFFSNKSNIFFDQ